RCATNVCVHWVTSTEDAPDLTDADADGTADWVETTAAVLEEVWTAEVTTLGYRPPKSDLTSPNHGPDGRLDVYLADIAPDGLYGYCTTDDPNAFDEGYPYWDVSAYCVLDDDYASDQFPSTSGLEALQVTAAHEFFHAVQGAYDWFEDPWFFEGTAAWMEDEVYDEVDDNLQYLPDSPLRHREIPLDLGRRYRYGAWIFWRFLSEYFGSDGVPDPTIVRRAWEFADGSAGGPDLFSARAAAAAVAEREWQLRWAFADFGVWNVAPDAFYEEGPSYPAAPLDATHVVSGSRPSTGIGSLVLDHLTNRAVGIRRGSGVPRSAQLLVVVDMAPYRRGSEASVIVSYRSGALEWFPIRLDREGDGRRRVDFGRPVREVILVLTNASIRYRCWMGTTLSCRGQPRDDDLRAWYAAALR
ncbi:MAG TPA: MXAN_6640 family putative metalloprotease, partial [Actinomycetota bacterium]|nr:MXAN_6640 family putative metalloprotease [Actinomycetota bacterium]